MSQRTRNEPRSFLLGLTLAVMALLGQVSLGAATIDQLAYLSTAGFGTDIPLCHAEPPDDAGGSAPSGHEHDGAGHALCPLCHVAAVALLPTPTPASWSPQTTLIAEPVLVPPARAPPAAPVLAATYPTGPPNLA